MAGNHGHAVLRAQAAALGVTISEQIAERMLAYLALLRRWNRVYNLTAITDQDAMISKHLLDCLACLPYLKTPRVLDVGSGAGLPGLILALADASLQCTLVEPNQKRTRFLRQVCIDLDLANVAIANERIENVEDGSSFDTLCSRAFGPLDRFLAATRHLQAPGVRVCAMKGRVPDAELAAVRAAGYAPAVVALAIPGLVGERHLVLIDC